jgi:hypothetical protein
MDPESVASGGIVAAVLVGMRLAERFSDKRNPKHNGNGLASKLAVNEEKLEALSDRVDDVSNKTREALSNTYEIIRRMDIKDAVEKDRRDRDDSGKD